MEVKVFATIFLSVFIAELGDKTQLATMLFAANNEISKLTVFVAASMALIISTALGIAAGTVLSNFIDEKILTYIAGAGFIIIGVVTLIRA